ncbi:hypothetical protein A6A07_31720 [Streptomyces sp. CB03911]|nr:hypothetical protein A6A07_31720 [Streptomyces sp. CB03911]
MLADTVRAPRTPPSWSPAAVEAALQGVLEEYGQRAQAWRDAFEGLDEDLLAEAATEARVFGRDQVAAVDHLVRDLTAQLTRWQQAIDRLADDLAKAAQGRPLPEHVADTGRIEDVRWRQARSALLEAVARHHHGALPAVPGDRPW